MRTLAIFLLAFAAAAPLSLGADRKPRVRFELVTKPGLPLTASQQWFQALTDLGISGLQIRSARPGDEMRIDEEGGKQSRGYKVVGVLAADNVLHLPGGNFKLTETARLGKWLENLGDEGAEGVTERRTAFGFTPRQLSEVNDDLKRPVRFSTKGLSASKAAARIADPLNFKIDIDDVARRELAGVKVAEELEGLTSGTALAAVLRPAGLVLRPHRPRGGKIQYQIGAGESDVEAWPVGWKPKDNPSKSLPELFEFLNVEIHEISVSEALAAIQARLKVPFLFDHNALALHGIDPAKVQADVPEKRMTYSQIMGKVLMQARLKYELRVDEAERPLVWITTVKPAQ